VVLVNKGLKDWGIFFGKMFLENASYPNSGCVVHGVRQDVVAVGAQGKTCQIQITYVLPYKLTPKGQFYWLRPKT
jgi:hypothetical protein